MAKQRMIDPKLWSDQWIRKLNPLDRYLFIYLLTNERSSWCGVYELDLGVMAFESGIDERDLEKSMLPRLSPKVLYIDGWVCFLNWEKYHNNGSEQTKKGIENAWQAVPEKIRLKIRKSFDKQIPPIDPLQGTPSLTSSFTSSSTSTSILCDEDITEDIQIIPEPPEKKKRKPKVEEPFSHSEEIAKLYASTRPDFKIIALYFERKGWVFQNKEQFNGELTRCLKPAKYLKSYTKGQIKEAFRITAEDAEERKYDWKLETVAKIIPSTLKK